MHDESDLKRGTFKETQIAALIFIVGFYYFNNNFIRRNTNRVKRQTRVTPDANVYK